MLTRRASLLVVILVLFIAVVCWAAPSATQSPAADCERYAYCDGTSFNTTIFLAMRRVRCDGAPNPRDHCCLPQAKHLVCYGISVDGMKLNYEDDDPLRTTDFTALCTAMAKLQEPYKKVGKHSSATVENGPGGLLIWRYGEWQPTDEGQRYIKNIACEITP